MARTDFRAAAARRLSEERELPPAIVSLLSPETTHRSTGVKVVAGRPRRVEPRAAAPRVRRDHARRSSPHRSASTASCSPSSSRPIAENRFQLIAGERRWRASKIAGMATIPALVEDIDDDTALEISIIENLQREDISPLDEAAMYDRMIRDHGYSIRRAGRQAGQGQGLPREPAPARRCAARGPRARVFAQGHPVPRLRADEGRRPAQAPASWPTRSPATSSRWSSCASGSRVGLRAQHPEDDAGPSPCRATPAPPVDDADQGGWTRDGWQGRAAPGRQPVRREAAAQRRGRGAPRRHPRLRSSWTPSAPSTGRTSPST